MFPNHPNLLPAFFDDDQKAAALDNSYARKPLYSPEGANIELSAGRCLDKDEGPYGAEGYVRQAIAPLSQFRRQLYSARFVVRRRRAVWSIGARRPDRDHQEHLAFLPHAIVA